MKRRLLVLIAVAIALLATVIPSTAALASGGDIYIELSDITIEGEQMVGETVTISGSATVTAEAEVTKWYALCPDVKAYAEVMVMLTDPDSNVAKVYTETDCDYDWGFIGPEDAEATINYDWSFDYKLDQAGLWSVAQSGYGYYDWEYHYFFCWWLKTASGSGEDFESISKEFMVGMVKREMHFTFNMPMGYGGAKYGDDSMNPGPIDKQIDCVGKIDGVQYRFVIPAGTVITNGNGDKALSLFIDSIEGNTLHSTFDTIVFSNPVTVYKAEGVFHLDQNYQYVGGEWIELGSFTEIVDYTATLN